jgi:hypothetical protein
MRVAFWRKMGTRSKFLVPVHSFPTPKRPPRRSFTIASSAFAKPSHSCSPPCPSPLPLPTTSAASPVHPSAVPYPLVHHRCSSPPLPAPTPLGSVPPRRALAPLSAPVHHRCPSPPPWPPHPSAFSQILPRRPILAASPPPPAHLNSRHHHWCSRIPSSWCSRIPSSSTSSSANQWRHNPS